MLSDVPCYHLTHRGRPGVAGFDSAHIDIVLVVLGDVTDADACRRVRVADAKPSARRAAAIYRPDAHKSTAEERIVKESLQFWRSQDGINAVMRRPRVVCGS